MSDFDELIDGPLRTLRVHMRESEVTLIFYLRTVFRIVEQPPVRSHGQGSHLRNNLNQLREEFLGDFWFELPITQVTNK